MKSVDEAKIEAVANWIGKNLMPVNDPWREGEARRLPDPNMTARYILRLADEAEELYWVKMEEMSNIEASNYKESNELR